jgi:hypothetical protein
MLLRRRIGFFFVVWRLCSKDFKACPRESGEFLKVEEYAEGGQDKPYCVTTEGMT